MRFWMLRVVRLMNSTADRQMAGMMYTEKPKGDAMSMNRSRNAKFVIREKYLARTGETQSKLVFLISRM